MASSKTNVQNRPYLAFFQIAASLLGFILSLFLLVKHYTLKFGMQDGASFCSISSLIDCDAVTLSPYAYLFGVPNSLIGGGFYLTIALIAYLSHVTDDRKPLYQKSIVWLSTVALVLDAYLLGVQIFLIRSICLLCVLSYALNLGILWVGLKLYPAKNKAWKQILFSHSMDGASLTWTHPVHVLAGISWLIANLFLASIPFYIQNKARAGMVNMALDQFFLRWQDTPKKPIDTDSGRLRSLGNDKSPVQLVGFSDFQCPFCRKAAFQLHQFLRQKQHAIYFQFRHYPLDSQCNPAASHRMHPIACDLAALSICAERKQKFWQFHDILFFDLPESQIETATSLSDIDPEKNLSSIFNSQEIKACLSDASVQEEIKKDLSLGRKLDIKGTPALFINGKLVSIPLNFENLDRLVRLEASR